MINLTAKSLNGDEYKVSLPDSSKLSEVASKIEVLSGEKFKAATMRLIHAGQDLSGDNNLNQTLEELGI